jgi:hypothetical protein
VVFADNKGMETVLVPLRIPKLKATVIPLTRGYHCIVDDGDFPELSNYHWYAYVHLNKRIKTGKKLVYAQRSLPGRNGDKKVTMHRHIMQPAAGLVVDHRNHNTLDNRRSNLQSVTHRHNQQNMSKWLTPTSSRFIGVSWDKSRCRWNAKATMQGKTIYLGRFKDEEEAARARDEYVSRMYANGLLNFN